MLKTIAIVSFAAALVAPAAHADEAWHWAVAWQWSNYDWLTCSGDNASVTFTGDHFVTELNCYGGQTSQPKTHYGLTLHIDGDVKGNQVTAKVTQVGTDASPSMIKGTIERRRSKPMSSTETGDDRIVLTSNDGYFIGLQRSFWHQKP